MTGMKQPCFASDDLRVTYADLPLPWFRHGRALHRPLPSAAGYLGFDWLIIPKVLGSRGAAGGWRSS